MNESGDACGNCHESTGGFDDGLDRFGMSDIELGVRFWLQGFELRVVPKVTVAQLFRKHHPYEVRWCQFLHNRARAAFVHFGPKRIARTLDCMRAHPAFPDAMAQLACGDAGERKRRLRALRRHDDDWYFHRFSGMRPIPAS